jgi:orotate phosphoribosyltransferase
MEDVVKILKDAGAILEGHFIGTSGRHLSLYINKDVILPKVDVVSKLGRMFAEMNKDKNIEIVAAPAVAAIPFSQWTAHHLSELTGKKVLSVFTEKTVEGGQEFTDKRGYASLVKGKRVLVVEDTASTGGSVKKTVEAVRAAGGEVVQVSLMINRDPKTINADSMGFPLNQLGIIPAESWGESEVPEWLLKIPVDPSVGHGAKYLKNHPNV